MTFLFLNSRSDVFYLVLNTRKIEFLEDPLAGLLLRKICNIGDAADSLNYAQKHLDITLMSLLQAQM
jgi:hypothetical protein